MVITQKNKKKIIVIELVLLIIVSTFTSSILINKGALPSNKSNENNEMLSDSSFNEDIVISELTNKSTTNKKKIINPIINITSPENSNVYILDKFFRKYKRGLLGILAERKENIHLSESARVYGPITIKTNVTNGSAPIRYVSFTITSTYYENDRYNPGSPSPHRGKQKTRYHVKGYRVYEEPYQYVYRGSRTSSLKVSATVVDDNNNSHTDSISVGGIHISLYKSTLFLMHLFILNSFLR